MGEKIRNIDIGNRNIEINREDIARAIMTANASGWFIQARFLISSEVRVHLHKIFSLKTERKIGLGFADTKLLKELSNVADGTEVCIHIRPSFGDIKLFPYNNYTEFLVRNLLSAKSIHLLRHKED